MGAAMVGAAPEDEGAEVTARGGRTDGQSPGRGPRAALVLPGEPSPAAPVPSRAGPPG